MQTSPKLLGKVRNRLKLKRYSVKTEELYVSWIIKYIKFHKMQHPSTLREKDIEQYLTYLAVNQKVAASTQNLAMNAILFLYKEVLEINLNGNINAIRAF